MTIALILSTGAVMLGLFALTLALALALSLRDGARSTPRSTAMDRLRAMRFEGNSHSSGS
jgi:hypothetical protein